MDGLDRLGLTGPVLDAAAVKREAAARGFDLCGISAAERHPRLAKLADWIAAGRSGEMTYLGRSLDERLDPRAVLPTARSVVSVACLYNTAETSEGAGPIARYARGDDYHDVMRERIVGLLRWMAARAPGLEALTCIDNGPVQERVFAEQAGLGWIGKNTCLINPRLGSWLLLGEIVTNASIAADLPAVDQCGSCTRCLTACPTGAFPAPYELDATKCLSYLTIELRGPVPEPQRGAIRDEVFGCDICQQVCPWNRRAMVTGDPAWTARPPLAGTGVADLCALGDDEWRALLRGSALRRAGLARIRRSLAYAAAHLAPDEAAGALAALEAHPSAQVPDVADAIGWARAALAAGG